MLHMRSTFEKLCNQSATTTTRIQCFQDVRCLRACIKFLLSRLEVTSASCGLQVSHSFLKALLFIRSLFGTYCAAFCAALIFPSLLSCNYHPLLLFGCSLVGMPTVVCWRMLGRVGHSLKCVKNPRIRAELTLISPYFDYCVWKTKTTVWHAGGYLPSSLAWSCSVVQPNCDCMWDQARPRLKWDVKWGLDLGLIKMLENQ